MVPEDPLARADESGCLAYDETPICLTVSAKDGVDDGAVIDGRAGCGCR